jgi:hypothetical protein
VWYLPCSGNRRRNSSRDPGRHTGFAMKPCTKWEIAKTIRNVLDG